MSSQRIFAAERQAARMTHRKSVYLLVISIVFVVLVGVVAAQSKPKGKSSSPAVSQSETGSETASPSAGILPSPLNTVSDTGTSSDSPLMSAAASASDSAQASPGTAGSSQSDTPSDSFFFSPSPSDTTQTAQSLSESSSWTASPSESLSTDAGGNIVVDSATLSASDTESSTASESITPSSTQSITMTLSETPTPSDSPTTSYVAHQLTPGEIEEQTEEEASMFLAIFCILIILTVGMYVLTYACMHVTYGECLVFMQQWYLNVFSASGRILLLVRALRICTFIS
jgi:hypothetical protein